MMMMMMMMMSLESDSDVLIKLFIHSIQPVQGPALLDPASPLHAMGAISSPIMLEVYSLARVHLHVFSELRVNLEICSTSRVHRGILSSAPAKVGDGSACIMHARACIR